MLLLLIAATAFVLLYAVSKLFPMTLMATILAIGAAAYAAFGEHEMTSAAAQTWGAIIVAAFALDVLCAVAKPRCASNAPSPNSSVPTSFVAHSSWALARRLTVWCGLLDVSAQDDACRWIHHVGLFARRADDGLVRVGIHGHIVGGKTLNAKAHVRAAVEEKRHRQKSQPLWGCWL